MKAFQHFEELERYRSGLKAQEERASFEARLGQGGLLAREWEDYQAIAAAVRSIGQAQHKAADAAAGAAIAEVGALRGRLGGVAARLEQEGFFHETYRRQEARPGVRRLRSFLAVAATLLLLAGAALFLLLNRAPDAGQLAAQTMNEQLQQLESITGGGQGWGAGDKHRQGVAAALQGGQAGDALGILRSAAPQPAPGEEDRREDEDIFLWGLAYYHNGDFKHAAEELERLLLEENPRPSLRRQCQWALAMACYSDGATGQARALLQEIAGEDGHPFRQQAARLLPSLK
ncbi:MAG: hypothetical protein J5I98_09885 [Phaeodactylibacter sp.]|nr:hypothetical protein [Phaeodactylibacter sp.]